jgi:hypothetical protein
VGCGAAARADQRAAGERRRVTPPSRAVSSRSSDAQRLCVS